MSVDSGLPDFRGNAGLCRAYPALAGDCLGFMDIACPTAFHAEPRRAWGFYGHRLALYRDMEPHHGHAMLRRWAKAAQYGAHVFTSNVDGHFEKAGFDPLQVDECHGSIHDLQCLTPCTDIVWSASSFAPVVDESRCELLGPLPVSLRCGGPARPNILMFNNWGWIGARHKQRTARRHGWLNHVKRPVIIKLGAGIAIPTVRQSPQRMTLQQNAALIRINPQAPHTGQLPGAAIAGSALDVLSAIDVHMGSARQGMPARSA